MLKRYYLSFSLYLCAFAPLRETNSYFHSATPAFEERNPAPRSCCLLNSGSRSLNSGSCLLNSDSRLLNSGSRSLNSDSRLLNSDSRLLNSGSRLLNSGSRLLNSGSRLLNSGSRLLNSGSKDLVRYPVANAPYWRSKAKTLQ